MASLHKLLHNILPLLSFIAFFSCNTTTSKNFNCEQFKNGNFIFKSGGMTFLINRQDSIQTETDPKTGYYSKLKVKWTDDCNYEGLSMESTFPFSDSIQNIRKTIPIKVQITGAGKDFYVFKMQRVNSPIFTDTMWLDKEN